MPDNDAPGAGPVWTPGTQLVGFIEDHYKLLHTKYGISEPCGFGEEDFLCFSHRKSMGANHPWGGAIFDPRGIICRIYVKLHITMQHTKCGSLGSCGF